MSVGNGTASVVVKVTFNVTRDDATERAHQFVHLARRRASNRIGNANAIDTNLPNQIKSNSITYAVHGAVDGQEVNQVAAERVFARKADFQAFALDEIHHLDSLVGNVRHVLAVRKLAQNRRRANHHIQPVHT